MSYRTYKVAHSLEGGFWVIFVKRSKFKNTVGDLASGFCDVTGHHFCNSRILGAIMWWADETEKVLGEIPITREIANKISWDGAEFWPDNDKDEGASL